MKLDRNITNPKRGKYALIKLRDAELKFTETQSGEEYVSVQSSAVDFGNTDQLLALEEGHYTDLKAVEVPTGIPIQIRTLPTQTIHAKSNPTR